MTTLRVLIESFERALDALDVLVSLAEEEQEKGKHKKCTTWTHIVVADFVKQRKKARNAFLRSYRKKLTKLKKAPRRSLIQECVKKMQIFIEKYESDLKKTNKK